MQPRLLHATNVHLVTAVVLVAKPVQFTALLALQVLGTINKLVPTIATLAHQVPILHSTVLLPAASLAHQVKFPVLQLLVFKTMVVLTAPCAQLVLTSLHSVWVTIALTAQLAGSKAKLVNPTAHHAQLVFQAQLVLQFAHHAHQVNTAASMQS